MLHNINTKRTKRSKPTPTRNALCKAPAAAIVVVKPAPQVEPLPEPLKSLLPTLPTVRPEHLRALSNVAVPIARVNDRRPKNAPKFTPQPIAKPVIQATVKGPAPRVINAEDIAEHSMISELIIEKLRQLNKPVSKLTIVCRFNGYFAMGAIVRGLRAAIKQGKVIKHEGTPSVYSLASVVSVNDGWTTQLS
jgi:hypothetical protein